MTTESIVCFSRINKILKYYRYLECVLLSVFTQSHGTQITKAMAAMLVSLKKRS